jgi:hypothetical protein
MPFLFAGLFLLTLSTLLLETLDARLLSVLTWYHLSFLAVSLAMLGMAAGAVFVFRRPDQFARERAAGELARVTLWFACAVPLSHVVNLTVPFLPIATGSVMEVLSIAVSTAALAVPFALSGMAVTIALTRCGGPIGRLYAWDLAGAAAGCALVVPLLDRTNVSSAVLAAGAFAALAAVCFGRHAGIGQGRAIALALTLTVAALANATLPASSALQIIYPKNRQLWVTNTLNDVTRWNSHSYVLVQRPREEPSFMWGPGRGAERFRSRIAWLAIDGEAGTPITEWDGNAASLAWVSYDVTAVPYTIRAEGDVAVIGLGGGRDVLSAIWGRSRSILGIDVNRIMIDLLQGSHRHFAKIADRPEVTLVHDDGRARLTRSEQRFDVIQMSLVDTWAATGAGAFTLSENGLYTLDAWRVFLSRLSPPVTPSAAGGVLSVSRWFDPTNASETNRLVSLGVAALLDRGVVRPAEQLILVVRGRVATLMVSNAPFTAADRERLDSLASDREFEIALAPWRVAAAHPVLERIGRSMTRAELDAATADPLFDYSAPTDGRPYYFNMLRPRALFALGRLSRAGAIGGNLQATLLLLALLAICTAFVAVIIIWPLAIAGRPPMPWTEFAVSMAYFAAIGFGYMLIQIALLQRFSVYIGHPTYTLAIVLFSMLLFTGAGSFLSGRVSVGPRSRAALVPAGIAMGLAVTATLLPMTLATSVTAGLVVRTLVVIAFAGPLAILLGMCFPMGVRLVEASSSGVTEGQSHFVSGDRPSVIPWAWGVNGAFSVLASISAVAISMWIGIDANFWIAAAIYVALVLPMRVLAKKHSP